MIKLRNDVYAMYLGVEGRFWEISPTTYRLQAEKTLYIPNGFENYDNADLMDKMYIDLPKNNYYSVYRINTYCNYMGDLYCIENIWNDLVVLSPEFETKKKLNMHIYDDKRIEVRYDNFIKDVEDIWEVRKPLEGFKFNVEPICYIKKNGEFI